MKTKISAASLASIFAFVAGLESLSAQSASPRPGEPGRAIEPVVELSPFVVNSSKDTGYQAMSTLAGTHLNSPLKDLGAAISIYTKDFLDDIGATSSSDFLVYATGMDAAGPGGNFSSTLNGNDINAREVSPDGPRRDPQNESSRARGLSAPTFTRDFFTTRIPSDTYNSDRVTVLRGPNAALFGVSSPAGVTDTSSIRADLRLNKNKVTFRYGNNGSLRSAVDFNRVLTQDKLALRVAGLQAREEFNQRPAFEQKERIFGTLTYKPFKSNSLRANFESGRHSANRPFTVIPAINSVMNDWYVSGRPGFDWTFYDDPARNPLAASQVSTNAPNIPYYMGQSSFLPIAIFYNNPTDQQMSYAIRTTTPNTNANVANAIRNQLFHPLLNRDLAVDTINYVQTRNIFEVPAGSYWIGTNVLPGQLPGLTPPGVKYQSFTDSSMFDWKNRMIDESSRQNDNFHSSNFVFEQHGWENRVGVELAFDQQRMDKRTYSSYFSGGQNNSNVRIDTTVTLPNGLPNPNLGRPYVTMSQGGAWYNISSEVKTRRATGYLRYDFKDLSASWGKWLGSHTLSGLMERYEDNLINYQATFRTEGPVARETNPIVGTRSLTTVVYLGPSVIGNNNPLKLEPLKIPLLRTGPVGDVLAFFRNTDDTDVGAFRPSPLSLTQTNANGRLNREVIESRAVTLQSYWLQDHVVTVLGWRRDEDYFVTRSPSYIANPADSNDTGKVFWGLDDLTFPRTPPPNIAAETKSYSVVLRWPQKLIKLPRGADFSGYYNRSENFTPIGGRLNWWGETLPSPKGTTKEYGLNFSAFNDKLTLRLNRFETASTGLSGGGTAAGAIGNVALNAAVLWLVEANTNPHLQAMRNADIALLKSALPVPNYMDLYDVRVAGTAPNLVATRQSSLPGSTDTTDFIAKGEELDIIYNPTSNWRILANVAHQETLKSNIGPNSKAMLAKLLPVLTQLAGRSNNRYPTGWQIGDPLPANQTTFGQTVDQTVLVPYATDRATEGDPSSEQRNWRFNLVSNYRFGGSSILGDTLKGWSIGGGLRWQSKMVLAYPSSRNPDTSVKFDRAHPFYAPAETNVDAFTSYGRKIWGNRIDWKVQLNVTNIYQERALIRVAVQPWGQPSSMRLAPERRWYLTNNFSF